MYKNEFQGGTHFEVFTAQGKDPTAHWKFTGSSGIRKEFDKTVRSYVYVLDGSAATTKIQLPKDAKHSLGLIQRHIVLQIFVPKGADFSVDLGIQDLTGSKRRLHFSTAIRETNTTPLHSKVPLGLLRRDIWLNLCLDLSGFVTDTWMGQTYKSLESICLSANCRLRRIFTLRTQPPDTTADDDLYGLTGTNSGEIEGIPKQCQLAPDILQDTQVINFTKVLYYEGKRRPPPEIVLDASSTSALDASVLSSARAADGYHIAFGTKIRGTAQKKEKREGSGTQRSSKPQSARTKPESGIDMQLSTSRQSSASSTGRPDSGRRNSLRSQGLRDRKHSDPGVNLEDPDVSVNKESLKTSHTWTDGADNEQESVPFVKPHPPREPSADRIRRKPRVKSAGKDRGSAGKERSSAGAERTPHASSSRDPSMSAPPTLSTRRQSGPPEPRTDWMPQPTAVASEEEMTRIMSSMNESTRRGMVPKSESESEPSSHNTSGVAVDDSLDDIINTLNKGGLTGPGEYEDTDNEGDEEDEDENDEQVFLYSSKPKSAPRLKKIRKSSHRSHKEKPRPSVPSHSRERLTQDDSDFTRGGESSEEEESIMTRVLKHHPASRDPETVNRHEGRSHHKHQQNQQGRLAVNGHHTNNPKTWTGPDFPPIKHSPRSPSDTSQQTPILPEETNRRSQNVTNTHSSPNGVIQSVKSSADSNSRMSIRKKSLREIPKDDVRLSQQSQKRYSPDKYSMRELTDSCEAAMLQSLRRQTLEDGVPESDEDPKHQQQQEQQHQHSHLHFSDHSLSDSSDDTSMSPLKAPGSRLKVHNYQEEMRGEFLNHSNPRDWGNVFSPPIVLPSQKGSSSLSPSALQVNNQKDTFPGRNVAPPSSREQGDTDEEDELDLLYDPVLNCYFDPKSCKYYELV